MDKKIPVGKIGHKVHWQGEEWKLVSYYQDCGEYFVELKTRNGRSVDNVNYEEVEE